LPSTPSQNMKLFAELVLIALQHSRLEHDGCSGWEQMTRLRFSTTIAKKLFDALVKVGS
jgi:hypothetical protein